MSYSLDDMVQKYLQLRDKKAELENRHKLELEPIKEALQTLEGIFGQFLEQNNMQSFKTEHGTPYRSKLLTVVTEDKNAFVNFALDTWQDLMDIRASKSGIQAYLDRGGTSVPGIRLEYRYNINVRRS